jgi:kynureninase
MRDLITAAIAALGDGPLCEDAIQREIAPLFSRVLSTEHIYLANHSLGRPLDAMADDVAEATSLWYSELGKSWDTWLAEQSAFRSRIAQLIGAPRVDCIIPKTSAGQGLRTVLNMLPGRPRVVSTRGEFDSVDVILKQYADLERIQICWIDADVHGEFFVEPMIDAVAQGVDLVVVSLTMFMTGQIVDRLEKLAEACHRNGARLLVDAYHAIGVFPIDVTAIGADFVIGGSYKYLRGGPGACFLYLSPEALKSGLRPLDTGWFAKDETFAYQRSEAPVLKLGGDAFLESTPPILTYYQARSGQEFVLGIGVARLREYSLRQLVAMCGYLAEAGVSEITGGDERHGAFLALSMKNAMKLAKKLELEGVICDARGEWLRICPDCLTRDAELRRAAEVIGKLIQR